MIGFSPRQIEKRFYSREGIRSLKQREIDHFVAKGVAPLDLAFPDMLLAARVSFDQSGSFLLADEMRDTSGAEAALVLLCRDNFGDAIDIVAWLPSTGRVATWLRRAWTIEEEIFAEFSGGGERQLPVFRSPMEWLRASRNGVVILDAKRTRWWVAYLGMHLIAEDVPHGRILRQQMIVPPPAILVASPSLNRAAA